MNRLYMILLLFLMGIVKTFSQNDSLPYPTDLLQQYAKSKPDTTRVQLLIKLSSFYLLKPGEEKVNLDSAILLAKEAKQLSESLKYKRGEEDADFWLGSIYVEGKDYPQVHRILNSVSDTNRIRIMDQLVDYKVHTGSAQDIDTALYYIRQILIQSEHIGYKTADQKVFVYSMLSWIHFQKGDYAQALAYGYKCIKLVEDGSATELNERPYITIGRIYFEQGNMEQSILYYQKAIETSHKNGQNASGTVLKLVARAYIKLNKPEEALAFLEKNTKPGTKYGPTDDCLVTESKGNCYFAMAQYDKAEQYYKKCLEIAKNLTKLDQLILYIPIAKLYIQTKQFDKAKYYVDALSTSESKKMEPLYVQRDVELMHFQTDSAFGNYTQAIAHLQLYKALNDSIFNDTKSKQLEELKVKYETDKKNKDIELLTKQSLLQASQLKQERLQFEFENEKKKHDLELLTFEADKKDKDLKLVQLETEKKNTEINLLQKNKEITEQQLSKESLTKKFLISAIICLILLSVVIVRVVMLKRKNEKHRHELAENESKIQQLENKKQFAEFEMQAQAAQIKAMVATQEQERKRISRDLHDDVGTKLSALNLYLSSLSEKATVINNDEIKSLAQSSKQFIKEAMHDVRELLFNLSPTVLEEFGYTTAVEGLVNKINETKQIHFDLVVFGINHRLKKDYELTLYRITQELINNVLKHAEAKHVSLQIGQRDEKIILMMEDDGIGFDVKAHQNGYGLHNLDARTKLMKGTMHIDSQPGKGTSVLVEIPYNYNGV